MPVRGFTLIEILVVVAIIAILVAILIPSLKRARENARASVCGHHIRELATAGNMWLIQEKRESVPAHRGWAPQVLKIMSGQTELFHCPSEEKAVPIAPVLISQYRAGYTYPMLSTDSGYFRHYVDPNSGVYRADMETEADVSGGDRDFNDASVYTRPPVRLATTAEVWAVKGSTGRQLTLHDWKGRTLEANFSSTAHYTQPALWGGFAMNLSAAIPGAKLWNVLYVDYTDWSAVVEAQLGVKATDGAVRGDGPDRPEWVALRHNRRANAGFLDTHVERLVASRFDLPANPLGACIWHPERPPGWKPPSLDPD